MAVIRPFRGLRYNPQRIADLSSVMALPYDVLTERDREELYQASPYNIIRLIWGKDLPGDGPGEDKYLRAALLLKEWRKGGILARDEQETFYLYVQDFILEAETKSRRAIIARVRLQDWDSNVILRHEETFPEKREDRLHLLRVTRANLDSIFALYEGRGGHLRATIDQEMGRSPLLDLQDRWGVRQRLWAIEGSNAHRKIQEEMEDRPLFIADGHHRYEAALQHRREMREKGKGRGVGPGEPGYQYVMMALTSMEDPGLVILPVHRLLRGMGKGVLGQLLQRARARFLVTEIRLPEREEERSAFVRGQLEAERPLTHRFLLYGGGNSLFLLRIDKSDPPTQLDAEVLDESILHGLLGLQRSEQEEKVSYTSDTREALREMQKGGYDLAFLVRPTSLEEVKSISLAGKRMPPKSTYFYPKLLSGLMMNPLEA